MLPLSGQPLERVDHRYAKGCEVTHVPSQDGQVVTGSRGRDGNVGEVRGTPGRSRTVRKLTCQARLSKAKRQDSRSVQV